MSLLTPLYRVAVESMAEASRLQDTAIIDEFVKARGLKECPPEDDRFMWAYELAVPGERLFFSIDTTILPKPSVRDPTKISIC